MSEKYWGNDRAYKLTAGTIFEIFEEYLKSELRTKRLAYILEIEKHANVPENKLGDD